MFKRIGNLIRGFFGLFVSGMEKRNPEALLELERENVRKQVVEFNKGLKAHAALCERLMTQTKKMEDSERELRAKTAALLKGGNKEAAGRFALRLQTVRQEHAENSRQLEEAEITYKELRRARDLSVKSARDRVESLERGISDMKVKQAMAELNEMAAGMINDIGGSGDTLNRLEEMVHREREMAAGRSRVARDSMDQLEIAELEAEQKAMEDLALADFAAEEGIVIEAAAGDARSGEGFRDLEAGEGGEIDREGPTKMM